MERMRRVMSVGVAVGSLLLLNAWPAAAEGPRSEVAGAPPAVAGPRQMMPHEDGRYPKAHQGESQEFAGPESAMGPAGEPMSEPMQGRWQDASPEGKEQFLQDHPRLRKRMKEKMRERMENAAPEQREQFLKEHPSVRDHMEDAGDRREDRRDHQADDRDRQENRMDRWENRRDRGGERMQHPEGRPGAEGEGRHDRGVRDHGQGQGRMGVGQGAEHRSPQAQSMVRPHGGGVGGRRR